MTPHADGRGGFEHASPLGHVPTVQHRIVQERLALYRRPDTRVRDVDAVTRSLVDPADLDQPAGRVRWALATDSSPFEAEVDPSFPSTRLVFMQMAAVLVDLDRMRRRDGPFVDPAVVRDSVTASVLAAMLPGSNLLRVDDTPPRLAFRQEIDHVLRTSVSNDRTLLEVLIDVLAHRDDVSGSDAFVPTCPNDDCEADLRTVPIPAAGRPCPRCAGPLLYVDGLRIHEAFTDQGSNAEASGRLLAVAERLISLTLLTRLEDRRPGFLGDVAFVTDGPLAIFGPAAKLKRPLLRLLQLTARRLLTAGMTPPVVVGVEKSGRFVDHARAIRELIPPGRLMVPSAAYVSEYVTHRRAGPHGEETYYGKHLFYRTFGGELHTITVPPLGAVGVQPHEAEELRYYPTLRATCDLLERIGTRMYPDATIPAVLAHRYTAYPLEMAGNVLKLHADDHLADAVEVAT